MGRGVGSKSIMASFPDDGLSAFKVAVADAGHQPAIHYFDSSLTYRQLDEESDALAAYLEKNGLVSGDRIGLFLQNVPQFVITLLAAWKANLIPVPINPMNKTREVSLILNDCGPRAIVAHAELFPMLDGNKPEVLIATSPREYQTRNDPRLFRDDTDHVSPGTVDLQDVIRSSRDFPSRRHRLSCDPDSAAFLVYTSGTTGVPKGVLDLHRGAMLNAKAVVHMKNLSPGDPVLGLAPLFHITGLVAQILVAFLCKAPIILSFRFDARVMLDSIREYRPAMSSGAMTAYIALMNNPAAVREDFKSFKAMSSGGAAVSPAIVAQFEQKFGHYLYQGYGLTETNGPVIVVPMPNRAKIDEKQKVLSIGKPLPHVDARIVDDRGQFLGPHVEGEIVIAGDSRFLRYWNKPEETEKALLDGFLLTGDIGFTDEDGWFYIVDRKKDMINAGGYKIWPREVEDVIYSHPAVREVVVVGVADSYRGETVKAFVSLKAGQHTNAQEIRQYCRQRMAAYKYPRLIEFLDDLPKTSTGKILRRELRELSNLSG